MSRDKDVVQCLHLISSVVPKSKIHFVQVNINTAGY
jgi:hypothetical protein